MSYTQISPREIKIANTLESSKQVLNNVSNSIGNPEMLSVVSNWMEMFFSLIPGIPLYFTCQKHDQQFLDLLMNREFIEYTNSILTPDWEKDQKKLNFVFWIFTITCHHCYRKVPQTIVSLKNHLQTALKQLSFFKADHFVSIVHLSQVFPALFLEFFWLPESKQIFQLVSNDLVFLLKKHGDKFGFDYLTQVAKFSADSKCLAHDRNYLQQFLSRCRDKISAMNLPIATFYHIFKSGVMNYDDFFKFMSENRIWGIDLGSNSFFIPARNRKVKTWMEMVTEIILSAPAHQDFISSFFHSINFKVENLPDFIREYPTNGFQQNHLVFILKHYTSISDEIFAAIRDKLLMSKVIPMIFLKNYSFNSINPPFEFLKKASQLLSLGFTSQELVDLIPVCQEIKFDLSIAEALDFSQSNQQKIDLLGFILHVKHYQKLFPDRIYDFLPELSSSQMSNKKIIKKCYLINTLILAINGAPLEYEIPENHVLNKTDINDNIKECQYILDELKLLDFSLVHRQRNFILEATINGEKTKIPSVAYFRPYLLSEQDFDSEICKIYCRLSNKYFEIYQHPEFSGKETAVSDFMELFKELFESQNNYFMDPHFDIKRTFSNSCHILYKRNPSLLTPYLEKAVKFLPKEYFTEIEKREEYRLILKTLRYDISTFNNVIKNIKRQREDDPLLQECADFAQRSSDPQIRELLHKIIKRENEFHLYEWLAKNPCNFVECPICMELKESQLIVITVPCGHRVCASCASQTGTSCPTCRVAIRERIPFIQPDSIIEEVKSKLAE